METTFMTIHSQFRHVICYDAFVGLIFITYFQPEDVTGRSCFEYFHPDEVPAAEYIYSRGVESDKASVLTSGDKMGSGSIANACLPLFPRYRLPAPASTKAMRKIKRRAANTRVIRRLFASSSRDPRYHILVDLSSKFRAGPQAPLLEPRAALILHRFTRTLTVMYATNAVASILGVTPEQLKDKSLYECMQGNCLAEAIRCLESAKANYSIAYLRLWRRDPRRDENFDEEMRRASHSSDSEDAGLEIHGHMHVNSDLVVEDSGSAHLALKTPRNGDSSMSTAPSRSLDRSRRLSEEGTDLEHDATHATFDRGQASRSSTSSFHVPTPHSRRQGPPHLLRVDAEP